jgi:hypothetical protein
MMGYTVLVGQRLSLRNNKHAQSFCIVIRTCKKAEMWRNIRPCTNTNVITFKLFNK